MRFIFVILYTLIVTQSCVSLDLQVTVEHAPLKACNAISEGVKQQLLNALDSKFKMLRKEIQRDTELKEYLKIDRTFRKIYGESNVKDGNELDTLKKTYKESIENATPSIIILYDDERFKQKISNNIDIISNNPVGAQLLIDILVETTLASDLANPIFIVSTSSTKKYRDTDIISVQMNAKQYKLYWKYVREYSTGSQFVPVEGDEPCRFITIDSKKFKISGYPSSDNTSLYTTKTKDAFMNDDCTTFHELNHYRHYLQNDYEINAHTNNRFFVRKGEICTRSSQNLLMDNPEEEFQLIGLKPSHCLCIEYIRDRYTQDIISEALYRYYRSVNSWDKEKFIRFPYFVVDQGEAQVTDAVNSILLDKCRYYNIMN